VITDEVISIFDSAADRDSRLVAPYRGQAVILRDTGALLIYYSAKIGWQAPWNLPWGEIAYTETLVAASTFPVADPGGPGAPILAVTFTPVVNRIYRVQFEGFIVSNTGGILAATPPDLVDLQIRRSGITSRTVTTIADYATDDLLAFTNRRIRFSARDVTYTPGASTTYTLFGSCTVGPATINAASTAPASLRVVDVGPYADPPT
jgi:hypothetical protein